MTDTEKLDAIFQKQNEIHTCVKVIETKVQVIGDTVKDHETRIRSIDKKIWTGAGIATAIASALGWWFGSNK